VSTAATHHQTGLTVQTGLSVAILRTVRRGDGALLSVMTTAGCRGPVPAGTSNA